MTLRLFLLTVIISIISISFSYGHGNVIRGNVSDSVTHEVLTGATVILNQNVAITSTDQLGNFKFDNLEDGTYTIQVTFLGYQPYELKITLSHNETRYLKINLSSASLKLEEVTILSSYSTEQTLTKINKIDLGLRPLKSSQDILRMIPGLVTSQHAGGGKAEQIFLRGFDADHGTDINLTVDGMPVNMVSHAHGQGYSDLHFITPEIIDFMDFNKGPYYSKVGDFGTAGYANIHTKNSIDKSSIKLETGSFNTSRTVALLDLLDQNKRNQNAYIAAEYQRTNGPFINPQNFNRINLFGKFNGLIGDNKIFSLSISHFKSSWDASGQIPERAIANRLVDRFGAIDNTEGGNTGRSNLNVGLTKVFNDGSSVKNQFYVSAYDFELYSNFTYFLHDTVNGDEIRQKEKRVIYGYSGTYQKEFKLGTKAIRTETGIGLRYDDISSSELSHVKARYTFINPISLGDVDQLNSHIYVDANLSLTNKLNLNAGIRFDEFTFQYTNKLDSLYKRNSASKGTISPKLNLYYNINPEFQLYIKNGIGFHSNDARVVIEQNSKNILPSAYGTDAGFFAKPKKDLLINLAFWQIRMEQEFVYVGDEAVVEPSGKTQRYGIDFSVRYQLINWLFLDFDGNYSHGRFVANSKGKNYIPLAPTLTSTGGLTANWKHGLRASLRYRSVSDRPANEENSVQAHGYFLLDGALTYTKQKFQISLNATNVLNKNWNEAQFDTETRLKSESSSISELCFTPGDPISLKAGVTFFF